MSALPCLPQTVSEWCLCCHNSSLVKSLINPQSPFINGDGSYSHCFTCIDNVIQANEPAVTVSKEDIINRSSSYNMSLPANAPIDPVFNVAFGDNTTLLQLFECLRTNLSKYDKDIMKVQPVFRENRPGDIPHSQASIEKIRRILLYKPKYNAFQGFERACDWYWKNLQL